MSKNAIIKINIIGNQAVGKTSLRAVYLGQKFEENTLVTVGYNKANKMFKIDKNTEIKVVIFDTAGQERFHSIALNTLKQSHGLILVYDVSNRQSFNDLKTWLHDINEATNKASIILFGNKCDIQNREITKEEAEEFAKENNIPYIETSAKAGINIDEGFSMVIKDAYAKYSGSTGFQLKKKDKTKKCCL